MADPTTLSGVAAQKLKAWEDKLAAARVEATTAQSDLTAAVSAQGAASKSLADAVAEAKRIRGELAAVPTKADAQPLLDRLDSAVISQATAEAAILDAERAAAMARARLERATTSVREAEAGRAQAQNATEQETRQSQTRANLLTSLGTPPLAALAADATALLASQSAIDAKATVEREIPPKLLDRGRERVTMARARLQAEAASRDAVAGLRDAQIAAKGSREEKVAVRRAAFDAALAKLEFHATQAQARFERAKAALARLAKRPKKLGLTPEQSARLNDAGLLASRGQAADHESALDQARRDARKAELDRDLELTKKEAGEAHDLAAKQAALAGKQTAEATAAGNYPAAERKLMREWAVSAPDAIWSDISEYDDATRVLSELATTPPGPLAAAVAAAEAPLAAALVSVGKEHATRDVYLAAISARSIAVDFDASNGERIAFLALRGNG